MKAIFSLLKAQIIFFLFLFLCFTETIQIKAQGIWVEQVVQPAMSGTTLTRIGADCIIHTRKSSRYVYFFDINSKKWKECDLGSLQNIKAVEAGKHVVFAYSDSLLLAYSSVTSTYQITKYSGNIISPEGTVSNDRGFGCGDNVAYAWTNQNICYVFDGLSGQWVSYNYGTTINATGWGVFWCGDNYVAGVFPRYYPDKYRHVVYSLVTKTFNITETGGAYVAQGNSAPMTGGYVSIWGGNPELIHFAGYSAFTNEFYHVDEVPPYGFFNTCSIDNENWSSFKERNVYGYCISRGTGYGEPRDARINVFDTQKASWFTHSFTYSPIQFGDVWVTTAGGNICSFAQQDAVSGELTFFVYNGETGNYQTVQPGVYYPGYLNSGNNFSVFLDDREQNNWFFNSKTGFSQIITSSDSNYINTAPSADYISFCRFNPSSTVMDIWFYNSLSDRSTKIQTGKDVYPHFKFSPQAYIFTPASPENPAVFYSAIHDSILPVNTVLANGNSSYGAIGAFAFLYNLTASVLFDAANMTVINRNAAPAINGISDSLVLFRLDNVFDVYDASNKNISTLNLGEIPGYQNNGGNVILISNSNFSRFYAFQRNRTEWVELLPEGNSLWYSSSENTAVVARTTKIYAFAPEGSAGIEDERINPPETIMLNQNYPNPFCQSTTISFRIPSKAFLSLKITNALGTIVSILVSEKLPEGTYKYNWDATGLPAGVYFYQLQTDGCYLTKKLILLK